MEFKDFEELVKSLVTVRDHHINGMYGSEERDKADSFISSNHWVTGGASGGSCWDTEDDAGATPYDGDEPEDLTDIDNILAVTHPDIPYMKYKQLYNKLNIQRKTFSENEYYGNYTDYAYEYLYVKDMYEAMKELNLV